MVVRATTATTATVPSGIVDLIGSGDSVYSLRKMRGAYPGAAIRVRRSSDNAETDIQFIGMAGIDTAGLLIFAGSASCFVTTWYDQSGNGRNLVQATAGSQPRIVNAGVIDSINERPTVVFDGVNDTLIGSLNTGISGDVEFTLNTVASYNLSNNASFATFVFFGSGPAGQGFHYMKRGASNDIWEGFTLSTQLNTTTPPTPSTLHTRTCVRRPSDSVRWESVHSGGNNGYSINNTNVVNVTNSPLYVGSFLDSPAYSSISISELILVNSAVEPLNRSMLEMNQGAYYKIDVTNFALDLVRNSSAASFSVRKLRRFYGGPAIRVRRSSDNAEQDIGFTQSGDLHTESLLSFVDGYSAFVATMYDQSGYENHATQATSSLQPQIVFDGSVNYVNNRAAICYKNNDFLSTSAVSLYPTAVNFNFVARPFDNAAARCFLTKCSGSNPSPFDFRSLSGSPTATLRVSAGLTGGSGFPLAGGANGFSPGIYKVWTANASATAGSVDAWENGIQGVTAQTTTAYGDTGTALLLGKRADNAATFIGDSSEVITHAVIIDFNSRQAMERNQGSYYGITVE